MVEEEQKQEIFYSLQEREQNCIPTACAPAPAPVATLQSITVAPEALQSNTVAQAPGSTRLRIVARKLVNVGRSPTPGGIIHDPPSPSESEPSSDPESESSSDPLKDDVIFTEFFYCDNCGALLEDFRFIYFCSLCSVDYYYYLILLLSFQ
jgi:hypothetical protein